MPVSIEPLEDHALWCELVQNAQNIWQRYVNTPPLNVATHMTKSLVFYDQLFNPKAMEDKSGIRTVNIMCPMNLYPEQSAQKNFYRLNYQGSGKEAGHFDQVVEFSNIVQTDTVSVLQYMTKKLIESGAELIQTAQPLESYQQLKPYYGHGKKTFTINATGHGAHKLFNNKPSVPIRGDLVLLRIPTDQLTPHIKEMSNYSFWAGGTRYVFLRYSLDKQWMEIVLGGTFISGDNDLAVRPETVKDIISFWLDFFHQAPSNDDETQKRSLLIEGVVNAIL
nr:FAD-dependent oxidoreductase [Endozoicomonas ascidiicola]